MRRLIRASAAHTGVTERSGHCFRACLQLGISDIVKPGYAFEIILFVLFLFFPLDLTTTFKKHCIQSDILRGASRALWERGTRN